MSFFASRIAVGRFFIKERRLELAHPLVVWWEGEALLHLARGVDFEELGGVIEDGLLGFLLRVVPRFAAELAEVRVPLADADVAGDEEALLQRDVELCAFGKREHEHVFGADGFEFLVAGDAVLKVDDVVALDELGEVNLLALRGLALALESGAASAIVPVSAKELRVANDGNLPRGECEAARENADDEA